jgi:hypothetical protein
MRAAAAWLLCCTGLGWKHRKPKTVSRKLDPEKQAAFIKAYEQLLSHLGDDKAVLFADAVRAAGSVLGA